MSGGTHSDGGNVLGGGTAVAVGVTALPNTGSNSLVQYLSIAVITFGSIVLVTTIARMVAKRAYRG